MYVHNFKQNIGRDCNSIQTVFISNTNVMYGAICLKVYKILSKFLNTDRYNDSKI